ncbi:Ribonuclease 2 [Linum perenne]
MASSVPVKSTLLLLLSIQLALSFFTGAVAQLKQVVDDVELEQVVTNSKQREFDYYTLALQWPATYCRFTKKCCSKNACCRGDNSPTEFTIHGLWPDYNDGSYPSCCGGSNFKEKELSTLLEPLNKYWPTLSCGKSSTCHGVKGSFWAHEQVLFEAGYVPSNTEKYPVGGIISAIQNAYRETPLLICSKGALEEVRLCFYKDFKPRECTTGSMLRDRMRSSSSSCPQYVSLPAFASSGKFFRHLCSQISDEK